MKLNQDQIAVAKVVNQKDDREVLTNVKLGNGKIIACNGYIMAESPVAELNGTNLLIKAETLLKCKPSKWGEDLTLEVSEDNKEVRIATLETAVIAPLQCGTFPEVDKLYPATQGNESVFSIVVNPTYLKKLADIAGKETPVRLTFYDTSSPIEFTIKSKNIKGLIMPMWEDAG